MLSPPTAGSRIWMAPPCVDVGHGVIRRLQMARSET